MSSLGGTLDGVLGRYNSDFYMIRPNAQTARFGCCSIFAQLARNGDGVAQSSRYTVALLSDADA